MREEADDRCVKSWRSTLYTGSVCANSAEFHQYVAFLNAASEFPTDPVAKCSSIVEESTYFKNFQVAITGIVTVRLY